MPLRYASIRMLRGSFRKSAVMGVSIVGVDRSEREGRGPEEVDGG